MGKRRDTKNRISTMKDKRKKWSACLEDAETDGQRLSYLPSTILAMSSPTSEVVEEPPIS